MDRGRESGNGSTKRLICSCLNDRTYTSVDRCGALLCSSFQYHSLLTRFPPITDLPQQSAQIRLFLETRHNPEDQPVQDPVVYPIQPLLSGARSLLGAVRTSKRRTLGNAGHCAPLDRCSALAHVYTASTGRISGADLGIRAQSHCVLGILQFCHRLAVVLFSGSM